ncbi:MAG: hypothetical protein RLZZ262_69 [Bacteroidota bacterium]|jgi:hypothetical protein
MELRERLRSGIKKEEVRALVEETLASDEVFANLAEFACSSNKTHAMKASWVIGHVSAIDNRMANTFLNQWRDTLETTRIGGVQREMVKIISHCDLPQEMEGWFLDKCFALINSATSEVASKYHALAYTTLQIKKYPELKEELASILEGQLTWHTPAWQRYIAKRIVNLRKPEKHSTRNKKAT